MSKYLGCYKDNKDRDLPIYKGNGNYETCHKEAIKNKKKYFGLQNYKGDINNLDCWIGDTYGKYGSDDSKCNFNKENNIFYGDNMVNAIYQSQSGEITQSYSEFRNQIQDWCQDLKDRGIYTDDEYQKCLKMYQNVEYQKSDGELNMINSDEIEYKYGYKQNPLYKTNPVSSIVEDDYQKIYLKNSHNYYLISNSDGQINVDKEPEIDKEREWNLVKLSEETYGIRSSYGKFIAITPDLVVESNRNDISPWTQFIIEKRDDKFALKSKSHGNYLTSQDKSIIATSSWTEYSNWTIEYKNEKSGQTFLDLYNQDELIMNKNKLISRMEESYKNYLEKSLEIKYTTKYIQELELLRNRQIEYLTNKINNRISELNNNLKTQNNNLNQESRKTMNFYFNIINQLFRLAQSNYFGDLYIKSSNRITQRNRQRDINVNGISNQIIQAKNDIFYVHKTNNNEPNKVIKFITEKMKQLSNKDKKFESEYLKIKNGTSGLKQSETKYNQINERINIINKRIELANRFKPQIEENIIKLRIDEVSKYQKIKNELIRQRYLALDEYKEAEKNIIEWKNTLTNNMDDLQKIIDSKLSLINQQIGKLHDVHQSNQELDDNQKTYEYSDIKGDINLEIIEHQKTRNRNTFWGLVVISFTSIMMILILIYYIQYKFRLIYRNE
jgi:hypothetical protein